MYRPPNRSNNDATFIVLQNDMIFCGVAVVPIGKLFEKKYGWPPAWQVGNVVTAECPLSSEQRKTYARFEFFRL
jgi:hypothetical protein